MRKATLIIGLVAIIVVLVLAFSTPPAVTLTVRALTDDPRVAELYPGSNFQAVAAVVEMKNNSKRELLYTAYYPCPRIPYFRCLYREAGAWQDDDALDTADRRSFVECPAAITGQPWGPYTLKPSETITFRADILRPKTECRIVVDYWEKGQRKTWRDRLPQWIAKRLPARRDRFGAQTRPIANGSDS
jgi:hypothetical protein